MKELLFVILFNLTVVAQQSPETSTPASSPAAQQAPTTKESAAPTTETSSPSAIPAQDANTGTVCDLSKNRSDGLAIISAHCHRESGISLSDSLRSSTTYISRKMLDGCTITRGLLLGYFNHKFNSDFSGVLGKLYVLRLPAGDYQFSDWQYTPLGSLGATERPAGIHPLTFAVAGGRAVYLGGFDPSIIEEGKNLFHSKVVTAWVLVHDDQSRDLPVFFNKCPGFDRNLLDIKVMDTSPWLPPQKK